MFRAVGLVTNPERADAAAVSDAAETFFQAHDIRCVRMNPEIEQEYSGPDMILTFGGDGTLLIGARYAMKYDTPLMGINLGTVGFLTETEPERLHDTLNILINGKYRTEERMLLEVRSPKTGLADYALNDVVITRGGYARLIRVECSVNGEQFGVFTSDGMIAATPTGSTGYSLSAGGPIIDPGMQCIALTPVCAHSLQQCPCIVSPHADIRFRLPPERNQTAVLQIDGMNRGTLEAGDEIVVTGADRKIRLVRLYPYHFYSLLHTKLREWGSQHA